MELQFHIKMNPHLYVRNPENSVLGKKIISEATRMIFTLGFEDFTFKKLATRLGTTEASIYRYFENKHRLLIYLTTWFWTWMEYQVMFNANNLKEPKEKINIIIKLLILQAPDHFVTEHIDKSILYKIVINEGGKSYLTKHVTEDNKAMLFKPYKDLCHRIAEVFVEYKPGFIFSHSLASTLIETAYHQLYFKDNLPRLTDFGKAKDATALQAFLTHIIFSALDSFSSKKKSIK